MPRKMKMGRSPTAIVVLWSVWQQGKFASHNMTINNYSEFWDFYVREHSKPLTRILHFIGTSLGIVLLIFFVARGQWYFFPVFFIIGYGFAWFAHFVVEKNKPASFKYPLWSFISDFKMMGYMITRRMAAETERVKAQTRQTPAKNSEI